MEFSIQELLNATGGTLWCPVKEHTIRRISIDSRTIPEDALFVPIIGENSDGHLYIPKAVNAGAKAVLSSENVPEEIRGTDSAVILVRDTVEALQAIGKAARERTKIPAVGVTGSVGKTTTREMVYRALSGGMNVYKTEKNYNNRLGVPLTLAEIPDDAEIAVFELGLNVPGELGTISALTNIDTAVITNIGTAHMEYYGNREGIAKEKFTVTKGFSSENPREKRLFLNGDDPYLARYREFTNYPATTYGFGPGNDYSAKNLRSVDAQYVFDLVRKGETVLTVTLSALGEHNVFNALAAMAVADHYGVDLRNAAEALASFTGFKGRLERIECRGALLIDDSYNASPASMKVGLKVLSELSYGTGKKIAVLGDMLELGPESDRLHYRVGQDGANEDIQEFLIVGARAKWIARGLKDYGSNAVIRCFPDRRSVLEYLEETFAPGNVYYFKASHGMEFSKLTEALVQHA